MKPNETWRNAGKRQARHKNRMGFVFLYLTLLSESLVADPALLLVGGTRRVDQKNRTV